MKRSLLGIACLLFAVLLISPTQSALAQTKGKSEAAKGKHHKVIVLKATKLSTRGEGADPNIKEDKQTNDPNAKTPAPVQKGGPRTRGGGACEVRFDNRTNLFIKLYVDGIYRGTVSPFGDGVVYTGAGETRVYARAEFDDGSSLYWGPSNYDCYPGQYIYYKMTR